MSVKLLSFCQGVGLEYNFFIAVLLNRSRTDPGFDNLANQFMFSRSGLILQKNNKK
jgi:hypothetical protein